MEAKVFEREYRDLAHVPRWTIARTIRAQSVAEHSYYVTLYAFQIAGLLLGWGGERLMLLMTYALHHDIEESFTSDLPGPTKRTLREGREKEWDMWVDRMVVERFHNCWHRPIDSEKDIIAVLKVANLMDEVMFLCGELQMGNKAIKHMLQRAENRLVDAWYKLPAPANDLQIWFVEHLLGAINRETNETSALVTHHSDMAIDQGAALQSARGGT